MPIQAVNKPNPARRCSTYRFRTAPQKDGHPPPLLAKSLSTAVGRLESWPKSFRLGTPLRDYHILMLLDARAQETRCSGLSRILGINSSKAPCTHLRLRSSTPNVPVSGNAAE